jgi:hypothetical protein
MAKAKGKDPAQEVRELIEELGRPTKMTKGEYAAFLEEVVSDAEMMLSAVTAELDEEEE